MAKQFKEFVTELSKEVWELNVYFYTEREPRDKTSVSREAEAGDTGTHFFKYPVIFDQNIGHTIKSMVGQFRISYFPDSSLRILHNIFWLYLYCRSRKLELYSMPLNKISMSLLCPIADCFYNQPVEINC